ncbi:MAG: hypothetical protein CK429_28435 [Mycobacterium sp.]|nr:MAG: hypothetical protein CK429_28435 [Mycobacterium sp.]
MNSTQILVRGIGALTVVLTAIVFTFSVTERTSIPAEDHYKAVFRDVSDLDVGGSVMLHGARIGSVSAISLSVGNIVITFKINAHQRLGSRTAAHITADTPAHTAALTLHSLGNGALAPGDTIPVERTNVYPQPDETIDVIGGARDIVAAILDRRYDVDAQRFSLLMEKLDELTGFLSENSLRTGSLIIDPHITFGYLAELRTAIQTATTENAELQTIRAGAGSGDVGSSALLQKHDEDTRLRFLIDVIAASLSDLAAPNRFHHP